MKARLFEHMDFAKPHRDRRYARLLRDVKHTLPRDVTVYPEAQDLRQHVDHLMRDKRLQRSLQSITNRDHREYMEALLRVEYFDLLNSSQATSKRSRRSSRRRVTI